MLKNLFSKKGMVVLAMVLFCGAIYFASAAHVIAQNCCEGDFDYDCDVDGSDLAVFAADFGRTDCPVAGPAPVEKTGQTTSYATGDDGDLEKGVAWPSPRFTDNGNGTVTDNLTGLIWLKDDICIGAKNWANALAACNALKDGQCGLTDGSKPGDWRLPNVRELHSLVDFGHFCPALPEGHPFSELPINYYWSSTTHDDSTSDAWSVYMLYGDVDNLNKTDSCDVWPVRGDSRAIYFANAAHVIAQDCCEGDFDYDCDVDGSDLAVFAADFGRTDCPVAGPAPVEKTGQTTSYATGDDGDLEKGVAWPSPRFTDNGNGTVTDNLTGLIWLKNAIYCIGVNNWPNALAACNALKDGQCGLTDGSSPGDWRLPNVLELHSLVDYGNFCPALPEGHPFTEVPPVHYWNWSSTTTADFVTGDDAWSVYITDGKVGRYDKLRDYHLVWPVRSDN